MVLNSLLAPGAAMPVGRFGWNAMAGQPRTPRGRWGQLAGIRGVRRTHDGKAVIEASELDLDHPLTASPEGTWSTSERGDLSVAEVTGPVTIGLHLRAAGLDLSTAMELATAVVAARARLMADRAPAPADRRLTMMNEPLLAAVSHPGFPLRDRDVAQVLSDTGHVIGRMGAAPGGSTGVRCARRTDWAVAFASDCDVVAAPVAVFDETQAEALSEYLDSGGRVAWGAIAVDGPLGRSDRRHWASLSNLWCALARRGVDPMALRTQALITPAAEFGSHTPDQIAGVKRLTGLVGERVRGQAIGARLTAGA